MKMMTENEKEELAKQIEAIESQIKKDTIRNGCELLILDLGEEKECLV